MLPVLLSEYDPEKTLLWIGGAIALGVGITWMLNIRTTESIKELIKEQKEYQKERLNDLRAEIDELRKGRK